jgi:hypothetical protein
MANTNAIANAASQIAGLKAPVMGVQVNKVFLGKAFVYVFQILLHMTLAVNIQDSSSSTTQKVEVFQRWQNH